MTAVEDTTGSNAEDLAKSDTATVSEDMIFPMPPTFDDVAEEREYRKRMLVDALHILGDRNMAEGAAGHITVRDPEFADRFWVNPFGMGFKAVQIENLICVDHSGEVVSGNCLLYTSPSPRDQRGSRMPSSA